MMMLMAAASVFVMTGCSDSPDEVVKNWGTAIIEGDKAAAGEVVANNEVSKEISQNFFDAYQKGNEETKGKFAAAVENIGEAKIDGDTAKVEMSFDKKDKVVLVLKKVDGDWKIDFEATMKQQ